MMLWRWFRRHSQPITYAWLTLLFVASTTYTTLNFQRDCESRREGREAVRSIGLTLRTLVESTAGANTDFSQVEGYADLDPSFRAFLDGLQASGGGGTDWQTDALRTVDRALDDLKPVECS